MDTIRRGEIAGIICLLACISSFIPSFIFGIGKSVVGDVVSLAIYFVVCVTYFMLLLAVQEIIESLGNQLFARKMQHFLVAVVISCLFFAPLMTPILVPDLLEALLGLCAVVLMAILGIVSIQIAPFFNNLEGDQTGYGKKAAKWFKISGWLMATVLLGIVGALLSLIADFYMWRLIKQERIKRESNRAQSAT